MMFRFTAPKTVALGLTALAATFFATPSFAGDVKNVGRSYESSEHNSNYRELDSRTKQNATKLKKQVKTLSTKLKKLQNKVATLKKQLNNLKARHDAEIADIQRQLSLGAAKAIIANDDQDGEINARGFNTLGDGSMPEVRYGAAGSYEYVIDFGVPMEDRFWTITNQFAKTRPDVQPFSRAEGTTIRISFKSVTYDSYAWSDFQLIVF